MTPLPYPLRARLAKVVGLYVLFSAFWIFVSDELLALFIPDPGTALWVSMVKGWLYILLTTALWYLVIGRLFQALGAQEQAIRALNAGLEQRVVERTLALEAEIAERWRAEAELRLSEERHRLLAEQSPDVLWTMNLQGELTYISPAVEQVLGFSREEYLRLPPTKTYSPEAWVTVQEGLALGIASVQVGQPFAFQAELENRRKDGATNWSDTKATALYDDQGRFVEFCGVTRDVTERKRNEERLRQSQEQAAQQLAEIQAYYDTAPVGLIVLDTELRYLRLNERLAEINGHPVAAHLGRTVREMLPAVADEAEPLFRAILSTGQPLRNVEITGETPAQPGVSRTWRVHYYPLRNVQGAIIGLNGVVEDITEAKAAEQALRASEERYRVLSTALERQVEARTAVIQSAHAALSESEERFRRLFEDTRQASVLYQDGFFTAANRAALDLLGMERPEQLVGHTPLAVSPAFQPDGRPSAEKATEMVGTAFAQGALAFEWELARPDGTTFLAQALVTAIHQRDGDLLHIVFSDITAQKQALERIEYLAYYDDLTGLPNRAIGHQRLHQALAAARRFHPTRQEACLAVLYLDLDRFKHVNDTYGHAAGDQLLRGLVQRLAQHLRTEDSLCRLAADEFMLILPEVVNCQAVAELAGLCERILASLAEPFDLDGRRIYASLSIGVTLFPRDGEDAETLMHNADTALFEAKRAGRQTYRFFEPRMNAELTRFIQTRDALREALARQEFVLHYQPKRGLRSGRRHGVEALLRWRRPEVGLVLPGDFIDVAEESGLILPIGRWVLHEACRQAARWRAAGWPDLVVGVNLSAVQFRQGQVVADVQAALEASGLDPAGLELELTESILLQGEDALLRTLTAWKAQGIQLAIDDFGTGYSSLAYLKRFPVDKLKIDRSFVKDLLTNAEDRAIVLAIIQIARSLNLRTVAEGVDDAALAEQLKVMGCDEAQGYLYAQPLPAEELRP